MDHGMIRCEQQANHALEGGIRVPFVISWPKHLQPAVYDKPVIQLDLHATALAAARNQTTSGLEVGRS